MPTFRTLCLAALLLAAGTPCPLRASDASATMKRGDIPVAIGLEMQPARLWTMRGEIFGLGFASRHPSFIKGAQRPRPAPSRPVDRVRI
ncbi:hypothetical protein [Massilia oculi]|uniref:hypothetical protein n=1 Tax=Massilia oculi TaxID=945844 RepID=UPI0028A72857|nr:hypothetical protein [Massilia oculi]